MEESALIRKSEKYLKEISKDEILLDNIEDFNYFKDLYSKLNDRLNKLQQLKNFMDSQGYDTPFRSLNRYGTNSVGEIAVEEFSENSRHKQYFRMKANAKKNILDRTKSAIDSHKIVMGNLEQFGYVKCENCYKKYRINEYEDNDGKCSCGSKNFYFKINRDNAYRLEILPYLPLSGNYRVLMNQFTPWERDSLKKVLNILKQERKGTVKTISLVIKIKDENNRWIRKNITLDSEYVNRYEVRIELLRFHRTKPAIIDDKHARTALAIGYVKYAKSIVLQIKDSILKKYLSDFKRLNTYNKLQKEIFNSVPDFIDKNDGNSLESWREFTFEEECKKLGYIDKFGNLNRSLKRDLKIRDNIENIIFTNIAPALIIWDIFRYYLTTSHYRRKTVNGPFPHIRVELDRQQIKIFQNYYKKVIKVLNNYTNLKIIPIENMDVILYEKFKLEDLIKNSNIKLNYPALGAALIHLNSNINIDILGNTFNINGSKINKEIRNIEKLKKPKSEKSKKFLEMIKK